MPDDFLDPAASFEAEHGPLLGLFLEVQADVAEMLRRSGYSELIIDEAIGRTTDLILDGRCRPTTSARGYLTMVARRAAIAATRHRRRISEGVEVTGSRTCLPTSEADGEGIVDDTTLGRGVLAHAVLRVAGSLGLDADQLADVTDLADVVDPAVVRAAIAAEPLLAELLASTDEAMARSGTELRERAPLVCLVVAGFLDSGDDTIESLAARLTKAVGGDPATGLRARRRARTAARISLFLSRPNLDCRSA